MTLQKKCRKSTHFSWKSIFCQQSCSLLDHPSLMCSRSPVVEVMTSSSGYGPTWDLALDPLMSCKLCLGEFPLEQMTTIHQCQCVFCTLVSTHTHTHR